ncbi:hypothetical protein NDU88_001362 [Pleurodeles waltl]|uniref:Uncharacterized protein n=1 Tax=Pleurodeles waltl TaxID=8319 RepID=A0AAV7TJG9_PLEWA|nr:hypothetical protein NDU88_001362 [Pleurodeles waltl]
MLTAHLPRRSSLEVTGERDPSGLLQASIAGSRPARLPQQTGQGAAHSLGAWDTPCLSPSPPASSSAKAGASVRTAGRKAIQASQQPSSGPDLARTKQQISPCSSQWPANSYSLRSQGPGPGGIRIVRIVLEAVMELVQGASISSTILAPPPLQ